MSRLRLLVGYDGTGFSGWQVQPGRRTVQGVLTDALQRLAGESVGVTGAGRTDAGVHATGQVASLPAVRDLSPEAVTAALRLPPDVAVLESAAAPDGFDARRDARTRHYTYLIWDRRPPQPLLAPYAWSVPAPLDEESIRRALRFVVGTHDFTSFARVRPDQSPVRTVDRVCVERDGDLVRIEIDAQSFLHQMVRSLVGSAVKVGMGRRPVSWLGEVLLARSRQAAGTVAPPHGLCLTGVGYDDVSWTASAPWPWASTTAGVTRVARRKVT